MTLYKAELRSIDAWRDPDSGWIWNDSFFLEDGIYMEENQITSRKLLRNLRKWGYLSDYSKGRVRMVDYCSIIEIQLKNTGEPLLALFMDEIGE
jgi:hypothetical protein